MASPEERAAADPRTDLTELARLAHEHPDLRPVVAGNPSAYEGLLQWLAGIGDPAVNAALAARGSAPAAPVVSAPASGWHEPAREVPLKWGTYDVRYAVGLGLLSLALVMPLQAILYSPSADLLIVIAVMIIVGIAAMPASVGLRVGAGAVALFGAFVSSGFYLGSLFGSVGAALPLLVWLMLRRRNGLSYLLLIAAAALSIVWTLIGARLSYSFDYGFADNLGLAFLDSGVIALITAGLAWLARVIHKQRTPAILRNRQAAAARAAYAQAPFAQAGMPVAQYAQPAYPATYPGGPVAAHPGAPTNTTAVLALVFGIGGGLLGIILGHVARAQMRRTGEGGWALATVGLVFGYIGLGAGVVLGIVYVVMLTR